MKKRLLSMLLALCMVLTLLPGMAWAAANPTAHLTPEISAAYLHVIENLSSLYGAPYESGDPAYTTEENASVYFGMCGGYIVDLGDGGYPEMIVAYSRESTSTTGSRTPHSSIIVYAWNGTEAVSVFEEQVLASGSGRTWDSYILCQNGNIAWLDRHTESLPLTDYVTGEVTEIDETAHYRMENGTMTQFTPQVKETSSVQLGTFDYITFNNYNELKALLDNSIVQETSHPYYDILTKCMADINYDNLGSYMRDECKGLLIDMNNDMIEELVIRYSKDYELRCDIWTIKNGQAACMFSETIGYYAGAGPCGRLALAESMGEVWLSLYTEYGETYSGSNEWTLYQLADGVYTKRHTFRILNSYMDNNGSYSEAPSSVTYFMDDVEVFENEFSSRSIQEIKQILNWEDESIKDESLSFEKLLANMKEYSAPSSSSAISVTVSGKAVEWSDAAPFIDANSRTMVPLRAVADAMGLNVNWDATAREAVFTDGSKTIYFPINSTTAHTNGGASVQMDTAAVIVNGRTYAPVRYMAEFFGFTVGWDSSTRTVLVT